MSPTVSGVVTDKSGNTAPWSASWTVGGAALKRLGWHADVSLRDSKIAAMAQGLNGITAYRVYAGGISSNGQDMSSQIVWCHNNDLIPVMSYKTLTNGFSAAQVISGSLDARVEAAATYLNSFGNLTYVALDHEPYDNFGGSGQPSIADFRAIQGRLIPIFAAKANIRVGPILHGWLLDNQSLRAARFDAFINTTLFDSVYDFFGIDSYQTGSQASPGSIDPGDRIAPLLDVMDAFGKPSIPLVIGEYNSWTNSSLDSSINTFLSTPSLEMACVWDRTGGVGVELSGTRKTTFENYKNNDPRVQR